MNIYKVTWNDGDVGYDQYDSFIVIAGSEDEARSTHPSDFVGDFISEEQAFGCDVSWCSYADRHELKVELIGTALEDQHKGVVLSSFNAG